MKRKILMTFALLLAIAQGTWAQETTQWTFTYTGAVQTFTVPTTGYYTLTCYGAQGGSFTTNRGGYGGTSQLNYQLTQGDVLYLYVGGQGGSIAEEQGLPDGGNGGWNGGGKGGTGVKHRNVESETPWSGGGGGGGATHIATSAIGAITSSSDFTSNHANLLLIAGGGGGGCNKGIGGKGGGAEGEKGFHIDNSYIWSIDWNNGTNSCGKDGMLSSWEDHSCEGCGGGGGGYVGGNTWVVQYNEPHQCYSGAGGSSWGDTTNGMGYTTTAGGATEGGNGKAKITLLFQGSGTSSDPYLISSVDAWNLLADQVAAANTYSGKYFQLTADISVTKSVGYYSSASEYKPFRGTFDGNGKTITINLSNQSRFGAPFKCVEGATIKNLHTEGTISGTGNSDGKLLGGIVGVSYGTTLISGCSSSVTLTTDKGSDCALGGLVGGQRSGDITIDGCVFTGSLTGGSSNTRCGGLMSYQWETNSNSCTVTNSLFAPTTLDVSTADDTYTKTITRATKGVTITNCYYTQVLGAAQGKQARSISAGTDVTALALAGTPSPSTTVGATGYSGNHGIKYNDIYYAGDGDEVGLTLSHDDKSGYSFRQYTVAGGGSLASSDSDTPKLTMTNSNQTINAQWTNDYLAFPLTGSTTLDLSKGIFGNTKGWEVPSYESGNKNIGYVREGGYANCYYVNNENEAAYYSLYVNIPWFKNSGTFTVTITDVATNTTEATATSPTITGLSDMLFTIDNQITSGVKKIRFDFHSTDAELNDHLYNINNVSFYRRSLNEDDDYTPIPATGVDVMLGRTLQSGGWNTFAVPFGISSSELTAKGMTVKKLTDASYDDGTKTLSLEFGDAESIEAGKPYLVKVAANVVNPTFNDVTIANSLTQTTITGIVSFVPVVVPTPLTSGDKTVLFVTGGDKLTYPTTNNSMKAFRAYFQLLGDAAAGAREFKMNFGDEEVTGIISATLVNSEKVNSDIYDLQGRKVAQPIKGLYIQNGKKFIIK